MEIIGYVASVVMGVSLGLIGGGGSILTIPILVYLFGVEPVHATAYSLFVVGFTSLVGSVSHLKNNGVHIKTALIFGAPSIAAVYATRRFAMPLIPDTIWVGTFSVTKPGLIMVIFAFLMLLASVTMIRKSGKPGAKPGQGNYNYPLIFGEGLLVGGVTGLVGAGGGFLIIPALVLLAGLPMKQAVGTSLVIIALKSLIGFTGDLGAGLATDYTFLILFTSFATAGILAGSYLQRFVSEETLKPAFGWFVLVMGVFVLGKELIFQ